ncbi:MAG: hypothetical protein QOI04_1843 [Verrucomicrobiota bacterium]|jgi:glucose-6-phosphate dehydrogenase assembly protein OpcA
MPAPTENQSPGLPVEIGKIDKELKRLWQESGDAKTRASLINLAVYSEAPDSLSKNTEIVSQVAQSHACRALVISGNPSAKENNVQAWIGANCHVSRAGTKQICSEQLSFSLEGPCTTLLPNIVFSHLDSDLPFYLWWQDQFRGPMDPQLWAWVDRVIYDSQTWSDFDAQMRLIESAQAEAKQRIVLCDLNWTRLVQMRLAVAQFFDHPSSHHHFGKIDNAEIDYAPGYRSTAMLLAGWLAAQLNWKTEQKNANGKIQFQRTEKTPINFVFKEKAGEPISRCLLSDSEREFLVKHEHGSDLLDVTLATAGKECMRQRLPAARNDPVDLVGEELMRGGPHRIYLRAVNCVRGLL